MLCFIIAFLIALDAGKHLLFSDGSFVSENIGIFAFALAYGIGDFGHALYYRRNLLTWSVYAFAWIPVIMLCAVLSEVLFYDSVFPIGGDAARYAAKWLSLRIDRMMCIGAIVASTGTYAWLMLNVFAKENDLFHFTEK